jgi:hypothetical protein
VSFCSNCGVRLVMESKFCINCGAKVNRSNQTKQNVRSNFAENQNVGGIAALHQAAASGNFNFGKLTNEYHASIHVWLNLVFGLLSILYGFGLAVVLKLSNESSLTFGNYIFFLGLVLFLLLIGVGLVALWYKSVNMQVQVFEHGFLYKKGSETRLFRWSEIENIKQEIVRMYVLFFPVESIYVYTIQKYNGESLELNKYIRNVQHLGALIQKESFKYLIPRVQELYNTGDKVSFGKFSISQAGIYNGKEILPWNMVASIKIDNGHILIKKAGQLLKWAYIPVSKIPNIYVFIYLVEEIIRSKH